jgi:hypothetical protein
MANTPEFVPFHVSTAEVAAPQVQVAAAVVDCRVRAPRERAVAVGMPVAVGPVVVLPKLAELAAPQEQASAEVVAQLRRQTLRVRLHR